MWRWWATNAPSRAVLDTCSSRSSESCTVRRACARRRDARRRRTWSRFENQLPIAARARRGRPTSRSPTASTNPTTNPTGTSHSSLCSEYDVNSTRTRQRASANSSGRSSRSRSVGRFAVGGARVGDDEHARAGEPGPPAQVEVLGTREGRAVEAAELGEEVGAHEHHRGGDVEDVADAVVLLLVELTRLDPGVRHAEAVDRTPDLEQHLGVRPRSPASDRRCPRSSGTPPPRAAARAEASSTTSSWHRRRNVAPSTAWRASLAASAKPAPSSRRRTNARGRTAGDPRRRVLAATAVDDEHREVVVVLLRQPEEPVLEPRTRVAGHDHGHDRRVLGEDLVGLVARVSSSRARVGTGFPTGLGDGLDGGGGLVLRGRRDGSVGRFERRS